MLSDRLSTLVEHGVLAKRRYQEHPDRYEYVLTEMGASSRPCSAALMRWGDRWLSPDGPPMLMLHRECGEPVEWGGTCPHCGVDGRAAGRPHRQGSRLAGACDPCHGHVGRGDAAQRCVTKRSRVTVG